MNRNFPLCVLVLLTAVSFETAAAQGNFVYVNSNLGRVNGMNSVIGFRNDGSGNLTQIQSSPFLTRGTGIFDPMGILNPTDADQQIIADPQDNFLYAVNSHSNTIAVFAIQSNGVLTPVPGSPFSSGGLDPASVGIDVNRNIVTVANRDGDPTQHMGRTVPNYKTFFMGANGALSPTGNSLSLTALSRPEQTLMDELDNLMFGFQYETSDIVSYSIGASGNLTPVSQLGPPVSGAQPLGAALNSQHRVLYVGFPVNALIGIYSYDSSGTLTFVRTIPGAAGNCWMAINAAGTRLYTADSGIASVSVYDLTAPTSPVLLQTIALKNAVRALNMALDPSQSFLYVLDVLSTKRLHVLEVMPDGTLQERGNPTTLPVSSFAEPIGVAAVQK